MKGVRTKRGKKTPDNNVVIDYDDLDEVGRKIVDHWLDDLSPCSTSETSPKSAGIAHAQPMGQQPPQLAKSAVTRIARRTTCFTTNSSVL